MDDPNQAAWALKSFADLVAADARALALAVSRGLDPDDLRRRVAEILRYSAATERAAEKFLAALDLEKAA